MPAPCPTVCGAVASDSSIVQSGLLWCLLVMDCVCICARALRVKMGGGLGDFPRSAGPYPLMALLNRAGQKEAWLLTLGCVPHHTPVMRSMCVGRACSLAGERVRAVCWNRSLWGFQNRRGPCPRPRLLTARGCSGVWGFGILNPGELLCSQGPWSGLFSLPWAFSDRFWGVVLGEGCWGIPPSLTECLLTLCPYPI